MNVGPGKAPKNDLKVMIIFSIPSSYFSVENPKQSGGESCSISRVVIAGKTE